jgi:predicted RNA-binding protein with PUA-like domain
MAFWLFKQEPGCYSYANLEADGATVWDGVASPAAQKNLRAVKPGDLAFFYHTGDDKAVVGVMEVVGGPRPSAENERHVVVEVKPVRRLQNPVTLAVIKADESLANWDLVTQPRLSVMPVTRAQWKKVEAKAKSPL